MEVGVTNDELQVNPRPYKRKSYDVEVLQFDGTFESAAEIVAWVTGVHNEQARLIRDGRTTRLKIVDDYGDFEVNPGDFVIRELKCFDVQPPGLFGDMYAPTR